MNKSLTSLEQAILRKIALAPENKDCRIEEHISFLEVVSREITGVGAYVNFIDFTPSTVLSKYLTIDRVFSSNHIVQTNTLKNGLGFALYAEDGRLKFLELFTYGAEHWDGKYRIFSFLEV